MSCKDFDVKTVFCVNSDFHCLATDMDEAREIFEKFYDHPSIKAHSVQRMYCVWIKRTPKKTSES